MRYVARETTALRHLRIEAFALFIKAIDKRDKLFWHIGAMRMVKIDRRELGGDPARYDPSHKKGYADRGKKHHKIRNQHGGHDAPYARMRFRQTQNRPLF